MLFLFYTNTFFFKFTKLNISTSLFKKGISFSRLTQTIKLSLQFLKGKTCESSRDYFRSIFFFHCGECYKSIGSNHADTSVGFHVFTGCDIIGRFLGKSKALWWKTFTSSSQEELRTLAALGDYETLPSASVLQGNI